MKNRSPYEYIPFYARLPFDIRGIIQLNSGFYPDGRTINDFWGLTINDIKYPDEVRNIKINSKANKIHFLTGLIYKNSISDGATAANLIIHFEGAAKCPPRTP